MEQLPGGDAIFLALETPTAPGHVGGLTLLDVSEAPDFGYERLVAVVDERIRFEPRFTKRLRELPLGLDRPYLVDHPEFDVRQHIHRIAVPAPGSMREIADLVGYLHSRPLDRRKPLWEMWLIEGVEGGRMAMFMKSHHCLMDGAAGAGIGELLCDLEPEPKSGPILAIKPRSTEERDYSDLEVALRAARNLAATPRRLAGFTGRLLRQSVAGALASRKPDAAPMPFEVPVAPFNGDIGPRRGFACASVKLEDVKEVKKTFDVTVNDVVLAITGSALRRYLQRRDELPEKPLVAMIAVSKRSEGDESVGNQVSMVPVSWATDEAGPIERLRRIHRGATLAKDLTKDHDADMLAGMGEAMPPGLTGLFISQAPLSLTNAMMPGNAIVSNVRGTPVPLYCAGARMTAMYPMSILSAGQGLNITVVSYQGNVDVGFTVDPELVPDAWALADAIPEALQELLDASLERRQEAA